MQKTRKYTQSEKTVIPTWINNYECARAWLAKMNGVKDHRALSLWHFCDWAKLNPDELLALKNSYESLAAETLLDKFCRDAVDLPESTRQVSAVAARSFFRVNYRQLQSEAGRMEIAGKHEQRSPRKQFRRQLIVRGCFNERDRAVIMVSTTSAIALETLSKLRWYHFEEDWLTQEIPHISVPSDLIKGHGKGKYRGVRQETFLTPEAKAQLIVYREEVERNFNHKWTEDDYVFLVSEGNLRPLGYQAIRILVQRIAKRAGVGFSIHDGRRIVQTALESVGCPNNWIKKVKGRKCSGEESPYSKPNIEQLRQKYREALPELEFLSESNVNVKKLNELEQKLGEKDQVIESLVRNGSELKDKMLKVEASREGMEALLKRVLDLEKKLSEK